MDKSTLERINYWKKQNNLANYLKEELDNLKEQIAYIRYFRSVENNIEYTRKWSEAQMLREMQYHSRG